MKHKRYLIGILMLLFSTWTVSAQPSIPPVEPQIIAPRPEALTIWEFMRTYTRADKPTRLQNSFAVGVLNGSCSGAMISPHLFMTAAHCGGPGWTGFVQFFRIDEDAPNPGPAAQALSERYYARTLPWQSYGTETGGGDTVLWWVDDGADRVPAGIKYGTLELNPAAPRVGDQAYSFWVNPVENFRGSRLDTTLLYSAGTATHQFVEDWRGPTTQYAIYGAPGASGSPVLADNQQVIGVTSYAPDPEGGFRGTADTSHFLSRYDADRNQALDAIEYDWLMTQPSMQFQFLRFDTPMKRAQWMKNPVRDGRGDISAELGFWTGKVTGGSGGPTDGLWHRTARFAPRATYRISAVVRGAASTTNGYVKFWTDTGSDAKTWTFSTSTDWTRVTGRVTLGNHANYRLILGTRAQTTLFIRDLTIVREDSTKLDFETDEERRTWEYVGPGHVTAWGLRGATDFSGVVSGACPRPQRWCLRNRSIALRANQTYEVTFTVQHVAGSLSTPALMLVQNLAGVVNREDTWRFTTVGQRLTRTVRFTTPDDQGQTLTFGTDQSLTYMVDDIIVREVGSTP